jgi:hypothetical protein
VLQALRPVHGLVVVFWCFFFALWRERPLPRLAGGTSTRYLLLGANTPWNRVRFTLGLGTSAASLGNKLISQAIMIRIVQDYRLGLVEAAALELFRVSREIVLVWVFLCPDETFRPVTGHTQEVDSM